ncbi:YfiR family protein [Acinetobacter sp. MD2(2019)]|uniref:YfiR family protein n=1 Tax=Acinetobacter sp. MD2(2019) TaxID=2605273 RepID=UPI002D76DFEF|nr:YfiR family protein [Acinetobacter sp. MD2(2019)]
MSTQSFYETTLSILSYAKWSANITTPNICIINSPTATTQFKSLVQQQHANYTITAMDLKSVNISSCQAIFFSNFSAKEEQTILNRNDVHSSVLSFSDNNSECEIGSAFCLYKKNGLTAFQVNLDSLSQAKVKIDPRVLLLAKPLEKK